MNNPRAAELKARSRQFSIDVIKLVRQFPRTLDGYIVGKQLLRAATGTAANYRAACRGRSPEEFAAKVGVAAEEADESQFWLDVTGASEILDGPEVRRLLGEAGEITAIFTASRDTTKRNIEARKNRAAGTLGVMLVLAIWAITWL
jgi:four helix bundle protein